MRIFIQIFAMCLVLLGFTETAMAASHLPEAAATALKTDMQDTFDDVMEWVWLIFPIFAAGWFAFNQSRKGAGKFGAN